MSLLSPYTSWSLRSVPPKVLLLSHPIYSSIYSTLFSASPTALSLLLLRPPVTSIRLNPTGTLHFSSSLISWQHLMRLIVHFLKYFLFTLFCGVTFIVFCFYRSLVLAGSIFLLNLCFFSFSWQSPLPSCVVGNCHYIMSFILSPLRFKGKSLCSVL